MFSVLCSLEIWLHGWEQAATFGILVHSLLLLSIIIIGIILVCPCPASTGPMCVHAASLANAAMLINISIPVFGYTITIHIMTSNTMFISCK